MAAPLVIGAASIDDRSRISLTDFLGSLETVFDQLYHINEIGYERQKAATLTSGGPTRSADAADFLRAAFGRDVQWVTRRRLREATGTVPEPFAHELLIPTR